MKIKGLLTSLIIRYMLIETTTKYIYMPIRMLKIRKNDYIKCCLEYTETESLILSW